MFGAKKFSPLVAALLLASTPVVHAEIASGIYTLSFNGDVNLWDISGNYDESLDPMALNYTLNLDAGGKFTGAGTANFDDGVNSLNADIQFNGNIKSAGSVVRVAIGMKMTGTGSIWGPDGILYDATFAATVKENVEVDAVNSELIGTASGRVTVALPALHRKKSVSIPRSEVQTSLPADVNPAWDMTLAVTTNKTKYDGIGAVQLSNGKSFPLIVTGSYNVKKDLSKISLEGQDLNRSVNLSLGAVCSNAQMSLQSLKGKALGQSLRLPTAH